MKRMALVMIVSLLFISVIPASNKQSYQISHFVPADEDFSHLTPRLAVIITNDSDFVSEGFSGSGTEGDPFRLEAVRILSDEASINISNTRSHFVIENVLVYPGSSGSVFGIVLENVTSGTFTNMSVYNHYRGIELHNSSDIIFDDIVFKINADTCFYADDCNFISFKYCKFEDNDATFLHINDVDHSVMTYNWFNATNTETGLELYKIANFTFSYNDLNRYSGTGSANLGLYESSNCTISHNSFYGANLGIGETNYDDIFIISNEFINGQISIFGGEIVTVTDNQFTNGGFYFQGETAESWHHDLSSNMIEGKPVGYLWDTTNTSVDLSSFSQIIFAGCNNVTGYDAAPTTSLDGIIIGFCNATTIQDSTIDGQSLGIHIRSSNYTTIENCEAQDSSRGVFAYDTKYLTINASDIHDNWGMGIAIRSSEFFLIDNSSISDNDIGILVGAPGSENCSRGQIKRSSIFSNNDPLDDVGYGVYVMNSNHIRVDQCNISYHDYAGMYISMSNWSSSVYTRYLYNDGFGIAIESGYDNYFYGNILGWNELGNAIDNGTSNDWNDVSIGNRWRDHNPLDSQYNVTGTGDGIDYYPQAWDYDLIYPPNDATHPQIQSLSMYVYTVGTTGHMLVWEVSDEYPFSYHIMMGGVWLEGGEWDGDDIEFSVAGFGVGNYTCTLTLTDLAGNSAQSSFLVSVVPVSAPPPESPFEPLY
ncbi:MAG: hypothetical protein GF411_09315, partial [Candidatus Lokiarchaeota archaeon]|nr:hypothetical protein [Candidatus Lokiarchaeota archaeon]